MKAVYRIKDGKVEALAGGPLSMAGLGHRTTRRASNIEFCEAKNVWQVLIQGEIAHETTDYDRALTWEREYFNRQLAKA